MYALLASGVMPPMWWAFETWKYTARDPCTGCVRTIGCSMGFPYFARSSGRVSAWSSSRLLNVVSEAMRRRALAVPVPDQSDEGKARHVVLGVVLFHGRPEHRGGGQILCGRQRLIAKHEGQMLAERA